LLTFSAVPPASTSGGTIGGRSFSATAVVRAAPPGSPRCCGAAPAVTFGTSPLGSAARAGLSAGGARVATSKKAMNPTSHRARAYLCAYDMIIFLPREMIGGSETCTCLNEA
jgi:hypothetical protein